MAPAFSLTWENLSLLFRLGPSQIVWPGVCVGGVGGRRVVLHEASVFAGAGQAHRDLSTIPGPVTKHQEPQEGVTVG